MDCFNWINLIIAGIAIVISGFTAYQQFCRKPRVKIKYKDKNPFHHIFIPEAEAAKNFNFNSLICAKVINTKRIIAKNCTGKLLEWYVNGKKVADFFPIKLKWLSDDASSYNSINLSYEEYDYIRLLRVNNNTKRIKIDAPDSEIKVNQEFDIKDEHKIKIAVYSENDVSEIMCLKITKRNDKSLDHLSEAEDLARIINVEECRY